MGNHNNNAYFPKSVFYLMLTGSMMMSDFPDEDIPNYDLVTPEGHPVKFQLDHSLQKVIVSANPRKKG